MSKTLAVFGATGTQGGSVINHVLGDPELSKEYKIRAVTRNVTSDKAKQLGEKVEVVQGDVLDQASLQKALAGVHTVFALTTPDFGPDAFEIEYTGGKTIADAAVESGAEYIIFSTLPAISEKSGGKWSRVVHFDSKAMIEQYIRSLPIKSAFVSLGAFMENYQTDFLPRSAGDGTFIMEFHVSPKTLVPLIHAGGDTGKFVSAILAQPDKYKGQTFCAAVKAYTMEEIAAIMSKATGKTVVYKQISLEDLKSRHSPEDAENLDAVFGFFEEFGYYGPDTKELVEWAAENARGRVSTLQEYLVAHPLPLA